MSSKDLRIAHAGGKLHLAHGWQTTETGTPLHSWFNATHARLRHKEHGIEVLWSSRAHRKGRYPHLAGKDKAQKAKFPRLWGWEFNNISWWVAQLFLWGSVAWVINGFFSFLWLSDEHLVTYGVGYTALVGGTLFEVGAILAVFEALNPGRGVAFGYEVHKLLTGERRFTALPRQARPPGHGGPVKVHVHHAASYAALDGAGQSRGLLGSVWHSLCGGNSCGNTAAEDGGAPSGDLEAGRPGAANNAAGTALQAQHNGQREADGAEAVSTAPSGPGQESPQKWSWWPRGSHKWHDLAFLAAIIQLTGATLFQWSVIMGVPGVLPTESQDTYIAWDITYWGPQVVGAWGFIISSAVFMLECQTKWYLPNPLNLGWQVGFWNFIGAWGFEFSGLFGIWAEPYERYQKWGTEFSTFWGGWAFLIGSYIQLVETLNKH
ncbi:hypothetical protein WJX72_005268 [[Myrmecia] bisecta]|uniref:Integral membrane protein n=1 Tax=[Myrmecia] bisecta TaxID=41462 RepID=A0AAW1QF40_9CHLO